jgi:polar amino acid transport system ATP-binding protein
MIIIKDLIIYNEEKNKILVIVNKLIINDGEILIIKGDSGKGKTLFLRTLAYEHEYFAGSIIINNKIFESYKDKEFFLLIQFVSQSYPIFNNMTCYEQIIHLLVYVKGILFIIAKNLVRDEFIKLNLWNHRNKYSSQLSGGQRQRVAIIQKTILEPKYLLLDEPTSGLDKVAKLELLNFLLALQAEGMTLIISTHDLEVIYFFKYARIYQI